jgi:hypothetical protein
VSSFFSRNLTFPIVTADESKACLLCDENLSLR